MDGHQTNLTKLAPDIPILNSKLFLELKLELKCIETYWIAVYKYNLTKF